MQCLEALKAPDLEIQGRQEPRALRLEPHKNNAINPTWGVMGSHK